MAAATFSPSGARSNYRVLPKFQKKSLTTPDRETISLTALMSGSSFSGPSRKSKFRAQRTAEQRPPVPVAQQVNPGPSAIEEAEAPPGELRAGSLQAGAELPMGARPRRPGALGRQGSTLRLPLRWRLPLLGLLLLVSGALAGYFLGRAGMTASAATRKNGRVIQRVEFPQPLTAEQQAQLDEAYQASKSGHYAEARQIFSSLAIKHPEWPRIAVDVARTAIYQADLIQAHRVLNELMQDDSPARADAFFMSGVMQLRGKEFPEAETAFGAATAVDPTQSNYYYFWGECLRQEGKQTEAGQRFRSALYRNQLETGEDLIQLKVWLCDISTDQDKSNGVDAAIEAELSRPFPRSSALMAMAARLLKTGQFAEAAGVISRGQASMDQVIFQIVMVDPAFTVESWRPELAPFYAAPARAAAPAQAGKAPAGPASATTPPASGPASATPPRPSPPSKKP